MTGGVTLLSEEQLMAMLERAAEAGARRALASVQRAGLSKSQLAAALGRSSSTIDRYVLDGMPYDGAGTRKTFDLEKCRTWLRERAPVRTNILTSGVVRKKRAC